jgi:hypothetical protein
MRNAYAVKRDPRLSWGGLQHPANDLSPARCMSSNLGGNLDRQSDCRYRARTAVRLAAGGK